MEWFCCEWSYTNKSRRNEKEYLAVNKDSTRIYIDSSATKGRVGGFAVSGRTPTKGFGRIFMLQVIAPEFL
ncbi:MAG: hypothetical protein MZV49_11515 [Rhodopseudomonas palustris]|nr:hypothetical protein [Rhodopseudomonas palustris]